MEFNPLKYLTFRRFFNLLLVSAGYLLSRMTGKPLILGKPYSLNIEVSGLCNLGCPECPAGTGELNRPSGLINIELCRQLIDEIKDHCFYLQLFFQGEPFLNPGIFEIIAYARSRKIYTSVSTNGMLLNDKLLQKLIAEPPDKIVFSIDGLDESTNSYRGVSPDKALDAFKKLVKLKKQAGKNKPFIVFQSLVMKQNEKKLDDIKSFALLNGADKVVFKSMQVYDVAGAEEFLPENPLFRRYDLVDGRLVIKSRLKNKCFALWRSSVVTWDGKILPCCFDKDAEFSFGDIKNTSLRKIWTSGEYNVFRRRILNNRRSVDMCQNCTEGLLISSEREL